MSAQRGPNWFAIPKGTAEARCRSCQQVVYWIETRSGKRMPVSVKYPGAFPPSNREDGTGISHFVDCPNAKMHRRRDNAR